MIKTVKNHISFSVCMYVCVVSIYVYMASLETQTVKKSAHNARDTDSIPGLVRSPGRGHSNPLQYSCLENPCQMSLAGYSPWGRKELDTT